MVLIIFVLNVFSKRVLNIQGLSRWDQRGDRRIRSWLSKDNMDDTIILWIRLRLCEIVNFLKDSIAGRS